MLRKLSIEEIWVLQLIRELPGLSVSDFDLIFSEAEFGWARVHLKSLEWWGLIALDPFGAWHCTWIGHGVNNWRTQVQFAEPDQLIPEPREGENGEQLGPPCTDYRPLLFSSGCCWCCRSRNDHVGEVVQAATRIICHIQ